jgi:hypothetical protein
MKLLRVIPAMIALAGVAGGLRAAPKEGGTVVVTFDHPEKFTDIKDREDPTDAGEAGILKEIKTYLVDDAGPRLPAGATLSITFTDIRLAGSFEPWHGPERSEIRYVRDIYPPFYRFSFVITDGAGKVLRQGKIDHTDLDFQTRLVLDTNDPLHYEKAYLDEWVRDATHGLR